MYVFFYELICKNASPTGHSRDKLLVHPPLPDKDRYRNKMMNGKRRGRNGESGISDSVILPVHDPLINGRYKSGLIVQSNVRETYITLNGLSGALKVDALCVSGGSEIGG